MRLQKKTSFGFTLVELVCTIAIMGILAASALPRFVSINQAAINASLNSMKGALETTSMLLRAKCIMTTGCDSAYNVQYISDSGINYQMWNGWPDAGDTMNNNELDVAITYSGYTVDIANGTQHFFRNASAKDPSNCYVKYQESGVYGNPPTITIFNSGC